MSGIYFFCILIFFCFFLNGYKKFSLNSLCQYKKFVIICALIIHILFIALYKKVTYITAINFIFNFFSAFIIYKFSHKYLSEKKAVMCCAFFILNPVFIIYCSTWTSFYSVYIFSIILMIFLYNNQKLFLGHIVFITCLFFYPFAIFLYPVTLIAQLKICKTNNLMKNSQTQKNYEFFIFNLISYVFMSISAFLILKFKLLDSLMNYPFMSCNAFNFWTALSHNWTSLYDQSFINYYFNINSAVLLGSTVIVLLLLKKLKHKQNSFLLLSLIYTILIYNFALMIHEDFFGPVLIILLILFIVTNSKISYLFYAGFSVLHFMNLCYSLSLYKPKNFDVNMPFAIILSFTSVLLSIFCIYYLYKNSDLWSFVVKPYETLTDDEAEDFFNYDFMPSLKIKYTKYDFIIMTVFTILFAIIAFFRLGNHFAPQTSYELYKDKNQIILNLGSETNVDHLSIFTGEIGRVNIKLSLLDNTNNCWYELNPEHKLSSEFNWNDIKINNNVQFIQIQPLSSKVVLREIAVCDKNNNIIVPINNNEYTKLFDEQNMHPKTNNYLFGTMFDEVYYTRTIYEFINGLKTYEITHPPLGKIIMTIGVKVFGLNPFGWRFMSVIFGIFMIPLMYIFSKRMFKNSFIPAVTTFLLCFDFMHFTLSRICTIDVFVAFFILLMYYFMYYYVTLNFNEIPLKKTLTPLLLCGISTALAISTKWTGFYAASGICIIFFASLYLRYSEYKKQLIPSLTTDDYYTNSFKTINKNTIKTLLFCILSFVLIPVSIYILSYKPVILSNNTSSLFIKVYDNLKYMFTYHTHINGTHPFSSHWYEWPLIKRPLWDSIARFNETQTCSSISTFGNPIIWWIGILCIIYNFYLMVKEKDRKAAFLSVSYLAQLIPWMFVSRYILIYHYFPCSLFQILIIGYTIEKLCFRFSVKKIKKLSLIYCILVFLAFAAFYPVISGYPVSKNYVNTYLELRETWIFE